MKYVLDAQKMQTRGEAHIYLKEMLGFPKYYGCNLDALYDCLRDMEDVEVEIQNLTAENKYVLKVIKVMEEAGAKADIV